MATAEKFRCDLSTTKLMPLVVLSRVSMFRRCRKSQRAVSFVVSTQVWSQFRQCLAVQNEVGLPERLDE